MTAFRPINIETDAGDIARLYNSTAAETLTTEAIIEWWTPRDGEIRTTMLALDEDGNAVGYWDIDCETWMKPGYFKMKVVVARESRQKGLGTQMYQDALCVAREHAATRLEGYIRDNDEPSLKFAIRRGFKIEHHGFASTLDLAEFDEHRFDDLMKRMKQEGFCFFSLAEAGLTEENKHKLYEVNRASGLDNPGNDRTFPDYYAFSKNVFEASWFRADTQIIASHADRWAGLSAIGMYPEDKHAYNAFTGVLREYRGRGLAQALKLQTILLAKREGMRYVRTNNDSNNAPMLAVNRKLGYKPEAGFYHVACTLDHG